MKTDLTQGSVLKGMLLFSIPLVVGNLLQQLYNVVDTLIVGRFLGGNALAAVGSAYTLMVFLTSISLGFCMGSGVVFSQLFGAKKQDELRTGIVNAFGFIGALTLVMNVLAYLFLDDLLRLLNIQPEAFAYTRAYLLVIFAGIPFTFLYNFFAAALRSVGNSLAPLGFLGISALANVALDIVFVVPFGWGVEGAALATVIAQALSALAAVWYFWLKAPMLRPQKRHFRYDWGLLKRVMSNSVLTSVQQSIMNLGILMVQGLVNSFGITAMAAFAAAVKIDGFAYMPVQDFGNAFSTYIAQNYGAQKVGRIKKGMRVAGGVALVFGLVTSALVFLFARQLMQLFISPEESAIVAVGATYLRIEGAFYLLIGLLFLLYGFYRGLGKPGMSVVLTVASLGTRVALSYLLAAIPAVGLVGIWWSIPIGWLLADVIGVGYYALRGRRTLFGGMAG